MSDKPEERRRHRRVTASIPIKLGGGQEGATQDLSEGGMGIVVSEKIEQGSVIEVLLGGEGAPDDLTGLKTMAKVMWSAETDSGAYTAGLMFDGPSPEALDRLRKFLKEHDGDE
jgi:hypothetical protein